MFLDTCTGVHGCSVHLALVSPHHLPTQLISLFSITRHNTIHVYRTVSETLWALFVPIVSSHPTPFMMNGDHFGAVQSAG